MSQGRQLHQALARSTPQEPGDSRGARPPRNTPAPAVKHYDPTGTNSQTCHKSPLRGGGPTTTHCHLVVSQTCHKSPLRGGGPTTTHCHLVVSQTCHKSPLRGGGPTTTHCHLVVSQTCHKSPLRGGGPTTTHFQQVQLWDRYLTAGGLP